MTEQIINRRLGNQENLNNWDIFWEIYFDEVDHNNYQEVSLKNLILMNSTPNKIDFTDCFEKMLFTVMKFINIDRNPFTNITNLNNDFINNGFINYIIDNFDINIIKTLTNDNVVAEYINDLLVNDANLSINIEELLSKLPDPLMSIISDYYIDDTYKLRQYIDNLVYPIRGTQEMITAFKNLTYNENPKSFDVIKKYIKEGILILDQELFEKLAANSNDEAVDLIINNLQTPQNPNGTILNTQRLHLSLAMNTNIRALNFYAENYRKGNFTDVFDITSLYSEEILVNLLKNKNSFPILDNLGIINGIKIRTNIDYISSLATNKSDLAVNTVIPYLMGLNYNINNSVNMLTALANNNNPIAVGTIISYLRVYTTSLVNSGRNVDLHFGRIIKELAGNSTDEAVDYVFEVLNNTVLNYIPNQNFWQKYMYNTNDRAVNYILDNINIIYTFPNPFNILIIGLVNKHPRMREYLRNNFLNLDMEKLPFLFANKEIFEIDEQDRRNKRQQIKTFMKNVYEKFNKRSVYRDESIYGLE